MYTRTKGGPENPDLLEREITVSFHRCRIVLISLFLICTHSFAQLSTIYVDATNGSDSYSGANATNSPSGTGPKATIHAGLTALADQGRMVVFAGTYAGDGIDTDGSPAVGTDNADIDINLTKYPRLVSGLTIELRILSGNNEVKIVADANSIRAPNGALITHTADEYIPNFIFNIPGGVLTLTTTNGTEYLSLAAQHSSGSPVASLFLKAGSIDILKGSSVRLSNGASITILGSARFLHDAPQKADSLNLIYAGGGSFIAGSEAAYGSFGSSVITINKDAGSTITFPVAMSFSCNGDAIRLQSGNAVFNGALTFGQVGSPAESPRTADLIVNTAGSVYFNAPVTLVVGNSPTTDNAISTIDNAGNGTVTFQELVTWIASYNSSDASFPASEATALVWNAGNGAMTFAAGAALTHASTTTNNGPVTVDVRIQNNGPGRLNFGRPITVVPRIETSLGATQQFSVAGINSAGGTLDISGALRSGLTNAPTSFAGGTININGATTLGSIGSATGALVNAANKTINLLSNTLTINGTVGVSVNGSAITATTGGIVVRGTGALSIDGGNLASLTIDQGSDGSVTFTKAANLASLSIVAGTCSLQAPTTIGGALSIIGGTCLLQAAVTIAGPLSIGGGTCSIQSATTVTGSLILSGGTCSIQSATTVTGSLILSGGTCSVEDSVGLSLSTIDFRQTGGVFNLGGSVGGEVHLQGNFTRSGGSVNAGPSSRVVLLGSGLQTFDPGTTLQLASLDAQNAGSGVRILQPFRVSRSLTIDVGCSLDLGSSTIVLNGEESTFTNNGSFTSSGPGITMGGATSVSGGAPIGHSEIHAGSQSSFSSFVIDVGSSNTCSLKAGANISWTGTLALSSGALDVASAVDFGPAGQGSTIVRDVVNSKGITLSAGTFNALGIHHALRLVGDLQATIPLAPDLVNDLPSTDSLIIDINSDTFDRDGDLTTGPLKYLQLAARAFIYAGSLTVGPLAAVQIAPNGKGGDALELNGTNVRHTVRGILNTADPGDSIFVSGANVSISGSSSPRDAALIGSIAISSVSLCTITDVKGFLGSFTTLPRSVVSLSMGATASEQKIQGLLTLNGSSFALSRNLEVTGGVAFNTGSLNLGLSNLQLTKSGDFVQGPNTSGYTTGGGYLIMNRAGAQLTIANTESSGVPNLQILANTFFISSGRVTKNLVIGSAESNGIPTIFLGKPGNDLIFTGSTITLLSNGNGNRNAIVSDGTTNGTPGGRLFVAGTSVTLIFNGDYSIEELTFNPPAVNGTLSLLSTDLTPHVLTISDILTHAGGQIGLGFNHLAMTGTGVLPGVRSYNRSDGTIAASSGEFRFVANEPQQFTCGAGFSVPNLRLWNPKGVTKSLESEPLIVTRTLDLSDGMFTFDVGTLILDNGATLVRRRTTAILSSPPTFRTSVNVSYPIDPDNGNLMTSIELPSEPGILRDLRVGNLSASPDSDSVILDKSVIVTGTLSLDAGQLDCASYKITVPSGATLDVGGGKFKSTTGTSGGLIASTYNLVYRKSAFVTPTSLEFPSSPSISIPRLSILGSDPNNPTIVYLYSSRTVGSLFINAPQGGIEFGAPGSFVARNLTVKDSLTILSGGFTNTAGTNAILNLAGTNRQIITVSDSGFLFIGGSSPVHLQLNNAAGFTLQGGNVTLGAGSVLLFVNGVLSTGDNAIALSHTLTSQGFDRQGVVGTNVSHILGKVRHFVTGGAGNLNEYPNGRYEFPTGTATDFRPFVITFTNAYPAKIPATVEVSHVDQFPDGVVGLPVDGGSGIRVGSYPPFYWLVSASAGSFGDDQLYDLEATVKNPVFRFSKAGELRFISRQALSPTSSTWNLLGSGSGYGSSDVTVTPAKDSILTIRAISAGKGLAGTNLVTVGLSSNRKPVLITRVPQIVTVQDFNKSIRFAVGVTDPDRDPVTISWKVNGLVLQTGNDTSFTYTVKSTDKTIAAVFADPFGQADSSLWTITGDAVSENESKVPAGFGLEQNYPNPFNPGTTITVAIPQRGHVSIEVYSLQGRRLRVLVNGDLNAGYHNIVWDGCDDSGIRVSSGTYFYQLRSGSFVQSRKMILLK